MSPAPKARGSDQEHNKLFTEKTQVAAASARWLRESGSADCPNRSSAAMRFGSARGNHLSKATCLMQVFFKSVE